MSSRKAIYLLLALIILAGPLSFAYAAGGVIAGTVTDPKGALLSGVAVSVIDPFSNQTYSGTTDKVGAYKIEGVPAGTYMIIVSATGFGEIRRENVKVEEGKTVTVDVKLEVAIIEETVTIDAGSLKGNADPTY